MQSIILLLIFAYSINAAKVFDIAGTFGNFDCMKNLGYYHSIIRAYHSYGAIDTTAPENIRQSNYVGMSTDVYMFPCRGKSAVTQSNELIDFLDTMMKTSD